MVKVIVSVQLTKILTIKTMKKLNGIIKMKNKQDVILEKTLKIAQIQALCRKQMVRCPASAAQSSLKSMAKAILNIIENT